MLLHRYSRQTDLLVGFVNNCQSQVEIEQSIDLFAKTLIQRTNLENNPTFRELVDQVHQNCLTSYSYQDLPFDRLAEKLRGDKSPLFQVKFAMNPASFHGQGMAVLELPDLRLNSLFDYIDNRSTADLILIAREQQEGLGMVFNYNTEMFDATTIDRMFGHFQTLLAGIVSNPEQRISELPLLTTGEEQQIVSDWNDTKIKHPEKCIHQLFEAQVTKTPDAIAAIFGSQSITYQELNHRANKLARYLSKLGVTADVPVGIYLARSLEMLIGLLGILKAGGAYVPLDPAYPQERLNYMLENADAKILITSKLSDSELDRGNLISVYLDTDWSKIDLEKSSNLDSKIGLDNLGYIIYTSGSTGKPKGVAMTQRALCNLILWQLSQPMANYSSKTLQFAPISFDVSFQEIFSTWCSGGTLVLVSEEIRRDPFTLLDLLEQQQIERLFLPFVALQQLAEIAVRTNSFPQHLRDMITAGEQLQITPAITKFFDRLSNCTLHNHYGPSETHVVTSFSLTDVAKNWVALPPIGKPIFNTQIYILDSQMQPIAIGVSGELYIGGDCLARGYIIVQI